MVALAAPCEDEGGFDLEVFGLEFGHQVDTRIKPEIKRQLDRREATFQTELASDPKEVALRTRVTQEHSDYQRRKERRAFVESGEAERLAQEGRRRNVRELAIQLAHQWKVPFIGKDPSRN